MGKKYWSISINSYKKKWRVPSSGGKPVVSSSALAEQQTKANLKIYVALLCVYGYLAAAVICCPLLELSVNLKLMIDCTTLAFT